MSLKVRDVLKAYKTLHRIVQETFKGDKRALTEGRKKINIEFKKNRELTKDDIDEKLKIAYDVANLLKHQVVQAVKNPEVDTYGNTSHTILL